MNETIQQPGRFENTFPIANVGLRIVANLIDFFIYWMIGVVFGMLYGTASREGFGYEVSGWPALVFFGLGFALWPFSEGVSGKTIGKRIMNLKVVNTERKDIGVGQAFVRLILGFVDSIFLIGIIIALIDKENRRLGDMAAGTLVVSTKK